NGMIPRPVPCWMVIKAASLEGGAMEASRGDKTICLPFESEEDYAACVSDAAAFRRRVSELYGQFPELFPSDARRGLRAAWSLRVAQAAGEDPKNQAQREPAGLSGASGLPDALQERAHRGAGEGLVSAPLWGCVR